MTNALVPISDLERMAKAIASSRLFGMQTPEQALALMLVAAAEGRHPGSVAAEYHIINGKPALRSDAMLARYLNSGGSIEWHEHTDEKVSATFKHPQGGSLKIDWDMARAKKAGLGGKDNWTKYPRQMLRARVISEGVRATNPAVAVGVYTVEETQDFDSKPKRKERDITPEVEHVSDEDISLEMGKDSAAPQAPPTATQGQASSPDRPADAADPFITPDQVVRLEELLSAPKRAKLLANVSKQYGESVVRLAQIKAADFADALAYAEAK